MDALRSPPQTSKQARHGRGLGLAQGCGGPATSAQAGLLRPCLRGHACVRQLGASPTHHASPLAADGLSIRYASNGMLGRGLYGAPDPRKSEQFCKNSANGKFMFVCRFNLKHAKYAGPSTEHKNTLYEEFCIYDDKQVVVLWMIKLRVGNV